MKDLFTLVIETAFRTVTTFCVKRNESDCSTDVACYLSLFFFFDRKTDEFKRVHPADVGEQSILIVIMIPHFLHDTYAFSTSFCALISSLR